MKRGMVFPGSRIAATSMVGLGFVLALPYGAAAQMLPGADPWQARPQPSRAAPSVSASRGEGTAVPAVRPQIFERVNQGYQRQGDRLSPEQRRPVAVAVPTIEERTRVSLELQRYGMPAGQAVRWAAARFEQAQQMLDNYKRIDRAFGGDPRFGNYGWNYNKSIQWNQQNWQMLDRKWQEEYRRRGLQPGGPGDLRRAAAGNPAAPSFLGNTSPSAMIGAREREYALRNRNGGAGQAAPGLPGGQPSGALGSSRPMQGPASATAGAENPFRTSGFDHQGTPCGAGTSPYCGRNAYLARDGRLLAYNGQSLAVLQNKGINTATLPLAQIYVAPSAAMKPGDVIPRGAATPAAAPRSGGFVEAMPASAPAPRAPGQPRPAQPKPPVVVPLTSQPGTGLR